MNDNNLIRIRKLGNYANQILRQYPNSNLKKHFDQIVVPLVVEEDKYDPIEFPNKLQEALKPFIEDPFSRSIANELIADLKKESVLKSTQNQKPANPNPLKTVDKHLQEVKARIKAPFKFDKTNGYETYEAFKTLMADVKTMRQMLEIRSPYLKGKALQTNNANIAAWEKLQINLIEYLQKNKLALAKNPKAEFKNLQKFLNTIQNDKALKGGDAFFKSFIKKRIGEIANAKEAEFSVPLKINFEKREDKLTSVINKIAEKTEKMGPLFFRSKFFSLVCDLEDNYLELLSRNKPVYTNLISVQHANRDYKALYKIDAEFKQAGALINILSRNINKFPAKSKIDIALDLQKEIEDYLKSFPKNSNENLPFSYHAALEFSNHLKDILLPALEEELIAHFINSVPIAQESRAPVEDNVTGQVDVREFGANLKDINEMLQIVAGLNAQANQSLVSNPEWAKSFTKLAESRLKAAGELFASYQANPNQPHSDLEVKKTAEMFLRLKAQTAELKSKFVPLPPTQTKPVNPNIGRPLPTPPPKKGGPRLFDHQAELQKAILQKRIAIIPNNKPQKK